MHRLPFVLIFVCSCARSAYADPRAAGDDDNGGETIVITDTKPGAGAEAARDRDRALAAGAPFVTVLHPDEHGAAATVADAAAQTPGVQVRALGGLGSYQAISIRGTASGNTTVLVDGIPLARLAAVTTDLGRFALDSFARVDLYRGAVPAELGGAGLGGAVNMVTRVGRDRDPAARDAPPIGLSIGYGSYGARHARAHYGEDFARARVAVTAGYAHAGGDFTFFDNRGTPLNPHDDGYETRRNNGFTQVEVAARIASPAGRDDAAAEDAAAPPAPDDGATAGGLRVAYRTQGLAGAVEQPTMRASIATLDAIGDVRTERVIGDGALGSALAYGLVERQQLDDPLGELGLGAQDRESTTLSGGATATYRRTFGGSSTSTSTSTAGTGTGTSTSTSTSTAGTAGTGEATLGVEVRGDHFADTSPAAMGTSGTRIGGALLGELALHLAPQLAIAPAVRVEVLRTDPAALTVGPTAFVAVPARTDVLPSPRLTASLALAPDLALKASGGWYARVPTLVELFGNRGFILGTPDLRPERGPNGDFGGVWAPQPTRADAPIDRILVEADVFATRARDTIGFITTAGYVTRAANLGLAQTYGAELGASVRVARTLALVASYTRVDTEQISDDVTLDGRALPRTPSDRLYARATLARSIATLWTDVAYQSTSYLDPANLGEVPARALVGAGASIEIVHRLVLALAVENLADTRVVQLPLVPPPSPAFTTAPTALADLAGYPLPGRSFYVSLAWNH